ncbi:MAG: hypothetical protein QXQ73_03230, partial [Desulfurococcaceae archaeon]
DDLSWVQTLTNSVVREHLYRKLRFVVGTLRSAQVELVSRNRLVGASGVEMHIATLASKTRYALHEMHLKHTFRYACFRGNL